jgi:pimeloyl-ACP methyl ester carboxylesterase
MPDSKTAKNGFVELPGAQLYYEIAGTGEPLVFLHGGYLDGRMWDEQFQFFAQHYQAIRYDMRYSGKSKTAPSTEPYTPYQDLYDLLQALHIPKATLIGLSGGARFALDYAIAYPDLVQKLILVSPGMSGYTFIDEWSQERSRELRQAFLQKDPANVIEIFLRMWTDGPYRTPEQVNPAVRERVRAIAIHTFSLNNPAPNFKELDPPAIGRLAEVHAPTLVVLGDKDTSDIHAIGKLLQDHLPTTEQVIIPDVGHILVMEKPAEFNAVVDRFLHG